MAAISMLVDHTFKQFEQGYIRNFTPGLFTPDGMLNYNHWICGLGTFMRGVIGRMAFPIFCFLLVQGFTHTSDKRKYKWRLFVFALLSEIPFNLALMDTYRFGTSNVIFTLLLGFVALEAIEADWNLVVRGLAVAGFAALAEVLGTDYGASGVLLITVLYLTRGSMAMTALAGMLSVLVLPSFGQLTATLAFIPIVLQRKTGSQPKIYLRILSYICWHCIWPGTYW